MTWNMDNQNSDSTDQLAIINLKVACALIFSCFQLVAHTKPIHWLFLDIAENLKLKDYSHV